MSWLTVLGKDSPGLADELSSRVARKKAAGEFSDDNVQYLSRLDFAVASGGLAVSDESLEGLRKLCSVWDVDLKMFSITSHRKILGPFIIALKKILFPVLRVFLKEAIQQQRAFNAEVISYLALMSRDRK